MKSSSMFAVSLAVAACALFCPRFASASSVNSVADFNETVPPATAKREAGRMVPAEAILAQQIDSKHARPGEQFQAKLTDHVQLKDGTELPKGTELIGTVATDHMGANGTSTLALNFTSADLKNGKQIPIRATIIGIAPPEYGAGWTGSATQAGPSRWNGDTLQVDEVDALSGVDLHSRIAGKNSGVFVSNKKDNMRISNQSQLSLAIAAGGPTSQMSGGA
jgi:hypothetical protein